MAFPSKYVLSALLAAVIGCAGIKEMTRLKENSSSCDSLIQSFPKPARVYLKDGMYEMGNKRIYKFGDDCYQITKDTIRLYDSTIEYWK